MKPPLPSERDIEELLAFLPKLHAVNFKPFDWGDGDTRGSRRVTTMPWPRYNKVVEDFFHLASRECWCDYEYEPEHVGSMIKDKSAIAGASLSQIKTMLTFCVRGERFWNGHWAAMLENGYIRALLERLAELRD